MVETEQPAKPFTGTHLALGLRQLVASWEQQQILLALMIPLVMKDASYRATPLITRPAVSTRLNSFRNDDPDSLIPMSYNGLVQSWLEITQLAHGGSRVHDEQADLLEQE